MYSRLFLDKPTVLQSISNLPNAVLSDIYSRKIQSLEWVIARASFFLPNDWNILT